MSRSVKNATAPNATIVITTNPSEAKRIIPGDRILPSEPLRTLKAEVIACPFRVYPSLCKPASTETGLRVRRVPTLLAGGCLLVLYLQFVHDLFHIWHLPGQFLHRRE